MKYKKYEFPSFNVYTVKTNKFKSCQMEIIYRDKVTRNDIIERSMLSSIIGVSSKKYPKKKDVLIRKEELYRIGFSGSTYRIGNATLTNFHLSFINPKYTLEKNYLEEVIKFPFEMLENPNVVDDEFDNRIFNIIKNNYLDNIMAIRENPNQLAINRSLVNMDADSPTSYGLLTSLEHLKDLTPSMLYKTYKNMLKNSICDIFVIGDLDMERVVKLIEKHFHNRSIKTNELDMFVENKTRKKPLDLEEVSTFVQSNLIMIYNLNDLTKRERDLVFPLFNHIFGTGTLNSKLYKYLREENTLCYSVNSLYLKYDKLLMLKVSLGKENIPLAVELINKALKEMQTNKFSDEELDDAKKSIIFGTYVSLDNPSSIIDNYAFHVFDGINLLENRNKEIKTVTKEELVSLAKKLKLNTKFVFSEKEGK